MTNYVIQGQREDKRPVLMQGKRVSDNHNGKKEQESVNGNTYGCGCLVQVLADA